MPLARRGWRLGDLGQFGLSEADFEKLTGLVMDGTVKEAPADEKAAPVEEPTEPVEETEEQPAEEEVKEEGESEEGEQLVTVLVNGKEEQLPLAEVIAGYQRQADYTQKTQSVAAERREVEQAKGEVEQAKETLIHVRQQEVETLGQVIQELQARFPIENEWAEIEQLKTLDPGEYARRRLDLQDKQAAMVRAQQMYQYQQNQQRAAQYPVEEAKLYERVPEWRDAKVRSEEAKSVSEFLSGEGFSPQELSEILDHRQLAVARKAWLYEKLTSSKAGLLQKKMSTAHKVVRPGVKADPGQASIENRAALREKLARSGNLHDAASLLESLL